MTGRASFPFERVLTPLGFVWLPVARVTFSNRDRSLEMDAVVDTGADLTMIPLQFGLDLRLKPAHGDLRTLTGISGVTPYLLRRVRLQIGSILLESRIAWAQSDEVPVILGRTDALERLKCTFDGPKRRLTLAQASRA